MRNHQTIHIYIFTYTHTYIHTYTDEKSSDDSQESSNDSHDDHLEGSARVLNSTVYSGIDIGSKEAVDGEMSK